MIFGKKAVFFLLLLTTVCVLVACEDIDLKHATRIHGKKFISENLALKLLLFIYFEGILFSQVLWNVVFISAPIPLVTDVAILIVLLNVVFISVPIPLVADVAIQKVNVAYAKMKMTKTTKSYKIDIIFNFIKIEKNFQTWNVTFLIFCKYITFVDIMFPKIINEVVCRIWF